MPVSLHTHDINMRYVNVPITSIIVKNICHK